MIPIDSARLRLDHTTLMNVERLVEGFDDRLKQLTREVDALDVEPTYVCDCTCNDDLADLQAEYDALAARIAKLEVLLTQVPGTTS